MFNKNKSKYIKNWIKKFRDGKITKEEALYCNIVDFTYAIYCFAQTRKKVREAHKRYMDRIPLVLTDIENCLAEIERGEEPNSLAMMMIKIQKEEKAEELSYLVNYGNNVFALALVSDISLFREIGYDAMNIEFRQELLEKCASDEIKQCVFEQYKKEILDKNDYEQTMTKRAIWNAYFIANALLPWYDEAVGQEIEPMDKSIYYKYFNENGAVKGPNGLLEHDYIADFVPLDYKGLV